MCLSIYGVCVVQVYRFHKTGMGGFADDVAVANKELAGTARQAEAVALRRLWLETFESEMGSWSETKIGSRLASVAPWQVEASLNIFRTPDFPTIAFTIGSRNGALALVLLGGCCDFPGGSEAKWWTDVIKPRVLWL